MSSVPLAALSIHPPQSDPISEYAKIAQLKSLGREQQTQQLQQTRLPQENQQRALQLQDAQTLRSLAPQFIKKDSNGNPNGYDFPGLISKASAAGVNPQLLNQMSLQ